MLTADQCQEFLQNPTINPATGRSITPTGAIYKKYVRQCGQPQVNISAPTIVSPKVSSSRPGTPPPVSPPPAKGKRAKTPGTKKSRGRPKGTQESPSINLEPVTPSSPININLPTLQRQITIAPPPPQPKIPSQLPQINFPKQPTVLPPSIPEFSNISYVQPPTTVIPSTQPPKTTTGAPKLPPIVPISPKQPTSIPQITPKQPPQLPPLPPGLNRTSGQILPPVLPTTVPKTPVPKTPVPKTPVPKTPVPKTPVQPSQVPTISNLKGGVKIPTAQPTIPKIPPPVGQNIPKFNAAPNLPKLPQLPSFPKGQLNVNPLIVPTNQRVPEEEIPQPELSQSQGSQVSIEEVPLGTLAWEGNSIMVGDPRDLFAFFRGLQDINDLNELLNDTEIQNFEFWTGGEPGLGSIIISNLPTNGSFNIIAERDENSNNIAIHLE